MSPRLRWYSVPKEVVTVRGAMNIKGANVSYRIEGEAETTKDRIAIGAATGISLNACIKCQHGP